MDSTAATAAAVTSSISGVEVQAFGGRPCMDGAEVMAGVVSIGVASPDVPNLAFRLSMEGSSPSSSAAQSIAPVL